MDTILVMGGTGNIGLPLIKKLTENERIKIKVGVRSISPKTNELFLGLNNVSTVEFNFLDSATFSEAFKGVSKIFLSGLHNCQIQK